MTASQENLVNINMSSIDDIESNNKTHKKMNDNLTQIRELTEMLHQERQLQTSNSQNNVEQTCVKILGVIVILVLLAPLTVANLYYAYTDDSCVHQPAGNLNVNLSTYLAVDGILGGIVIVTFSLLICSLNLDDSVAVMKGCCMVSITILTGLFTLAWTIVGSIIFWGLIDNEECSKGVYNYIFTLLIIRYVSMIVHLYINNNKKG